MKRVNTGGYTGGGNTIPEWLLVEVLIRLPVKLVFRSKLVCKEWLSMILDPYFVLMYISRASELQQPWTFISGLEGFRRHPKVKDKVLADIYSPCLEYPSVYVLPCPFGMKDLAGISNGLLLCAEHAYEQGYSYYNILNHVTRQWIALPPLALPRDYLSPFGSANHVFSIGFLTRVENGVLTSYGVVHLWWHSHRSHLLAEVFLSEIGEWKTFAVSNHRKVRAWGWSKPKILNGILHWVVFADRIIITYDPYHNPDSFRFIALPGGIVTWNDEKDYLLDTNQGRLRYFEYATFPHIFGIWLLNDYSNEDWCLQHMVSSADILYDSVLPGKYMFLEPLSFHPSDPDIVYMVYNNIFISYNIRTRKLEPRGQSNYLNCGRTFLFLMPPWPTSIPSQSFGVTKN